MSANSARSYRKKPKSLPPFPLKFEGVITDLSPHNLIDTINQPLTSNVDGDVLVVNADDTEYVYLISLVSNGAVSFFDLEGAESNGGWDGANYAGEDITNDDSNSGPKIVSLDFGEGSNAWYLYRTDYKGIGSKSFKLVYDRNQFNY